MYQKLYDIQNIVFMFLVKYTVLM